MNHQEFRDAICNRKPRYITKFKPLIERISSKGDVTGKGDFSTFGAFYQTFMYAYIIGLRLGEKEYLKSDDEKTEFAPLANWKPTPIRDFILITLFNRSEKFEKFSFDWLSLENGSEEHVSNFITMLVREMGLMLIEVSCICKISGIMKIFYFHHPLSLLIFLVNYQVIIRKSWML